MQRQCVIRCEKNIVDTNTNKYAHALRTNCFCSKENSTRKTRGFPKQIYSFVII